MRKISLFLITSLMVLLLGACTAVQPPTPATTTDSTPMAGSDSMAGMDHGNMNMDSEIPFDATFIDGMIEHHQGAIDMAEMALEQAEHEEIRTLSEEIIAAQQGEIEQMQQWRSEWFPDLEATEGMAMDMGQMSISDDESVPFDQRFIEAMISHHQGAISMAEMALEMSEREEIRSLAEDIIADGGDRADAGMACGLVRDHPIT
jgi:uncharacterized protein (DUF305 family)